MDTSPSWEEFRLQILQEDQPWLSQDNFLFSGYFEPFISPESDLTLAVEQAERLEGILLKHFHGFEWTAVQTPDHPNPRAPESRYEAFIFGEKDGSVGPYANVSVNHLISFSSDPIQLTSGQIDPTRGHFLHAGIRLDAIFPLGDFTPTSIKALEETWSSMRGLSYAKAPEPPEGADPRLLRGGPAVYILRDDVVRASGHPAIAEIGAHLPRKRLLVADGYRI